MNKLSYQVVVQASQNRSVQELVNYLEQTFKNIQIQVNGQVLMISLNSPLILATGVQMNKLTNQWESFSNTIKRCNKIMNIEPLNYSDELVDQLLSSQTAYSFAFDMESKQIINKFQTVAKCLDSSQNLYYKVYETPTEKHNNTIKLRAVPYGIQFQASYVKDKWVLTSSNNYNINNTTFNTKTTVFAQFVRLLGNAGLTVDQMRKNSVYSFILGVNEFSPITLKSDYLILISIYIPQTQKSNEQFNEIPNQCVAVPKPPINVKSDPMIVLRNPCMKPFIINTKNNTYGKVTYLLKQKRQKMIQEGLDNGIPISYCLVTKDRVNYQYNTSLFDTMWQFYVDTVSKQHILLEQSTELLNPSCQQRFAQFRQQKDNGQQSKD